jgi:hypothetical protein
MVPMVDRLYNIAVVVLILISILGVATLVGALFYNHAKQKRRKNNKSVDYSDFARKDAKDYIRIDDIKDDMIVLENGFRFVGIIDCQGFDFYSAHVLEQGNTVQNYLGFINTINKPITYRQYSRSVDLENTIEMYMEAYTKVTSKLEKAEMRLNEMQGVINSETDMAQLKKDLFDSEIEKTRREVSALNFRKFHLEDQIRYINENSGVATAPLISSTYVFDWEYKPMEFSVDLTDDEILARAKAELDSIASAKIHALSMAGVKAKRCKTNDLIDMCRRHSQPISGERYRMSDVLDSTYFEDITTTDCLDRVKTCVSDALEMEIADELESTFKNLNNTDSENNDRENLYLSAGSREGEEQDDINEKEKE